MLQRQTFQEHVPDEDSGQSLTPSHAIDLLKRRWLHFLMPFVLLLAIGSAIAMLWPATYLAEGKILVESPQIPSDLVRPTVAVLANERVQIIQQRIMTRDNLLAIAKKFQLSMGFGARMKGTELVDFLRDRTQILPLELKAPPGRRDNQAIAFTVGFLYEQPVTAAKVANELLTMILNEDVRGRTNSASETARFLEQDVKRLETQISTIDGKIADLKRSSAAAATIFDAKTGNATSLPLSDDAKQLAALKAELLIKSATLSGEHPDIKALKRRIEAFEKTINDKAAPGADAPPAADAQAGAQAGAPGQTANASPAVVAAGLDALATQRSNLDKELANATQKLAAARLGESLERGQYAERLQVIEQPTVPEKPLSPNRPKILAFAFIFAFMASGGLVFAAETLNPAIRRSADLYSIIDSHLIVTIPYITTLGETRRRKRKIIITAGAIACVAAVGVIAVLFILPPLDVLVAKFTARLLG